MVIMPALFAFGYAAENRLNQKMLEMAQEADHSKDMAVYTTVHREDIRDTHKTDPLKAESQLTQLYRQSVEQSGVCVVPTLRPWHKAANFFQENPFKILAGLGGTLRSIRVIWCGLESFHSYILFIAVPTVAYIFYGRAGQEHIPFQLKVMHTRVFGQFAIISMLLGLMGFKEYMDHNGKFITEDEAARRVEEMRRVRQELLYRLELEKQHQQEVAHFLEEAHEQDVKEGNVHEKRHRASVEQKESVEAPLVAASP